MAGNHGLVCRWRANHKLITFMKAFSRRRLLRAGGVSLLALAALSTQRKSNLPETDRDIRAGFIYVGARDDFGYNQAHATAAARLSREPGVKLFEQERIPETAEVTEVMRGMIEGDGVNLVFPTSYGYFDPYVLDVARAYPEVQFVHAGGLYLPGHPANVSTYFAYIDEGMFLAGVAAGHASRNGRLGFVAAMMIPHVYRNINAFLLGARLVQPFATLEVRTTGRWFHPEAERDACNSLIDSGADVITCHVDSPRVVVETSSNRDVSCVGYHSDLASLAPGHVLTSVQWDWWPLLSDYLEKISAGEKLAPMQRLGLREGIVVLAPFGPRVPSAGRAQIMNLHKQFLAGERSVYTGPIYDRAGEALIPAGVRRERDDPWLETMDWFVQGVQA